MQRTEPPNTEDAARKAEGEQPDFSRALSSVDRSPKCRRVSQTGRLAILAIIVAALVGVAFIGIARSEVITL